MSMILIALMIIFGVRGDAPVIGWITSVGFVFDTVAAFCAVVVLGFTFITILTSPLP